jgi:hypothetical protein
MQGQQETKKTFNIVEKRSLKKTISNRIFKNNAVINIQKEK